MFQPAASIIRAMTEAGNSCVTVVDLYWSTRHIIAQDSNVYTRLESLISMFFLSISVQIFVGIFHLTFVLHALSI
jgi:uncharacterized membrane protein